MLETNRTIWTMYDCNVCVQYYRLDSKLFECKLKSYILYIKIDINSYEIWLRSHVQHFICDRMVFFLSFSSSIFFFIRIQWFNPKKAMSEWERSKMHLAFVVVAFFLSRLIVAHVNHCKTLHPHINCQQYFLWALFYNFSLIFSVIFFSCRFVLYYLMRECTRTRSSIIYCMILFRFAVVMRLDLLWKRLVGCKPMQKVSSLARIAFALWCNS